MVILPSKWKQWTVTEEIGAGSYGTVYKAENVETGEFSAIKVIPVIVDSSMKNISEKEGDYDREYYFGSLFKYNQEISIMQQLKNKENIVEIIDSHIQENKEGNGWTIYIMMEYLKNISEIMTGWDQINEKDVAKLGVDICKAIEACAEQNIIHRDIKPENILVSEDGTYKLGDFGVAKHIEKTVATTTIQGTYSFMAPEIIQMKKYSKKVDVYSLGMILYRFMNRNRDPFVDLNKKIVFYQDKETSMERRIKGEELPSPVDASDEFAEIILKACEYSAEDRYDIEEFKADLLKYIEGKYRLKKKRGKKTRYYYISNKKMKRWLATAACLVMCIIASLLYYIRYDASFEFKDKPFGENGSCTLRNGTLVIEGEWDYDVENNYPWRGYEDKIEKVELVGNITYIGYEAFKDCSSMKSISGLDNVTFVAPDAFSACYSLERIDGIDFLVPDCISGNSFDNTPWLESHSENGFFIVDDKLIRYSGKKENITLPENVTTIGSYAFAGCDSVKSITGLENVTEIGECAFSDCDSLESITGLDKLTTIGYGAFESCNALKSITGLENVTELGSGAFLGCVSLDRIESFDFSKIDTVYGDTFDNTPWLKNNSENGFFIIDNTLIRYSGQEENIKLPESVTKIASAAFSDCRFLESITGMENVTEIEGYDAFFNCMSLKRLEGLDFSKINNVDGAIFDNTLWLESKSENGFFIVDDTLIRYSGQEDNIKLPENVTKIGNSAFSDCNSIKSITGLENVTEIGEYAFAYCDFLESITGLENVKKIEPYAFGDCTSLDRLDGLDFLKIDHVSGDAFDNTPWLKSKSENGFFIVKDKLLRYSGKEKNVKLPENVTKITDGAFSACECIETITNLEHVKEIGEYAFSGCSNLESVSGMDHVSSIGEGSFEMCYSLKNIDGTKKNEILKRDDLGLEDTKVFEK